MTKLTLVPNAALPDFQTQLTELQPLLLKLARKLCGRPDDACDLVQDTFERALRAGRSPNPNLKAWLISILQHRFIDIWRKRSYAHGPEALDELVVATKVASEEEPRWAGLDSDHVRAAVDRLHTNYREVFVLHALEGMPYTDVARRMGIPKATVGTRLFRARQQLRQLLEDELAHAPQSNAVAQLSLVQRRARASSSASCA